MFAQLSILIFMLYAQLTVAATNSSQLPEQLFLDIHVEDILQNTSILPLIEPWSSEYVEAIRSHRYGDAVWARFHIEGGVKDGIILDTNTTILDSIREDAVGYKLNSPVQYAEALEFYANTGSEDKHPDVIKAITDITPDDISRHSKRAAFSTSCSNNHLARQSDCQSLLRHMYKAKVSVADVRAISTYGGCRLRVGPFRSAPDVTYRTVYASALMIEEKCESRHGCCMWVSGYSPRNNGHRKICLSSKRDGCS